MRKLIENKIIRRFTLIIFDLIMLFLSYNLSFFILKNYSLNPLSYFLRNQNIFIFIILSLTVYIFSKQYKLLSEHFNRRDFYKLVLRNTFIIFNYYLIERYIFKSNFDFGLIFIIWIFTNIFTCSIRILIREIYLILKSKKNNAKKFVAIYGAGQAGAFLNYMLIHNDYYNVQAFIDDSISLQGREISGIPIYSPAEFFKSRNQIKTVLLSIPS